MDTSRKNWQQWPSYKVSARLQLAAENEMETHRAAFRELFPQEGTYPCPELLFFSGSIPERADNLVVKWLGNYLGTCPELFVTINHFSGLPPHVVYARVLQPNPDLDAFALGLIDLIARAAGIPNLSHSSQSHLRIPLITDLPGTTFHQAMKFFSHRECHETFRLEEMLIRKKQPGGQWQVLQHFLLNHATPPLLKPVIPLINQAAL